MVHTDCLAVNVSYVGGRCRNMTFKAGTSILSAPMPCFVPAITLMWKDGVFAIWAMACWLERCGTNLCANMNR